VRSGSLRGLGVSTVKRCYRTRASSDRRNADGPVGLRNGRAWLRQPATAPWSGDIFDDDLAFPSIVRRRSPTDARKCVGGAADSERDYHYDWARRVLRRLRQMERPFDERLTCGGASRRSSSLNALSFRNGMAKGAPELGSRAMWA
jgi:hypothetical protein